MWSHTCIRTQSFSLQRRTMWIKTDILVMWYNQREHAAERVTYSWSINNNVPSTKIIPILKILNSRDRTFNAKVLRGIDQRHSCWKLTMFILTPDRGKLDTGEVPVDFFILCNSKLERFDQDCQDDLCSCLLVISKPDFPGKTYSFRAERIWNHYTPYLAIVVVDSLGSTYMHARPPPRNVILGKNLSICLLFTDVVVGNLQVRVYSRYTGIRYGVWQWLQKSFRFPFLSVFSPNGRIDIGAP